jgi:hypothetical protein
LYIYSNITAGLVWAHRTSKAAAIGEKQDFRNENNSAYSKTTHCICEAFGSQQPDQKCRCPNYGIVIGSQQNKFFQTGLFSPFMGIVNELSEMPVPIYRSSL